MLRIGLRVALVVGVLATMTGCDAHNWLQWADGPMHSGNNATESTLSIANVSSLHSLFVHGLSDPADGAPVIQSNVNTPTGTRDVMVLETKGGSLRGFDAHTGAQLWQISFPAGTCVINKGSTPCYTTSSPAIDPNGTYVYAYGLNGRVHKVAIATGVETVDAHWPELTTLKRYDEKGSSALTVATAQNGQSYLYVTHAGYPGDNGDYQGHITAIKLSDGSQRVFNTLCSNQAVHFKDHLSPDCAHVQSGVWARDGVVYDPTTDRIFFSSGNGDYNPSVHDWGDTVGAISPDGAGNGSGDPIDAYTPTNYQSLDDTDTDLGSTLPAVLPQTNGHTMDLGVQSGKDGKLRLLNLADLSGQGGPGHTGGELQIKNVPQGGEVLTTPVVWTNPADNSVWVFVANQNGTSALKLVWVSNSPQLQTQWQRTTAATTPVVADGVLYLVSSNFIGAYNAVTNQLLWHDRSIGSIHWQSPIVNNGIVYIEDNNKMVRAFGA